MTTTKLQECEAFKRLELAVERDLARGTNSHDYRGCLQWIIDRVNQYAEATGVDPVEILTAWEKRRTYWYMNYYQECKQPKIDGGKVRVFDTKEDLFQSVGDLGFRCPNCHGVTPNPYECESGVMVKLINAKRDKRERCNWKVYGLFGSLGKGINIFIKDGCHLESIFMPIAWEPKPAEEKKEPIAKSNRVEVLS